MAVDSPPSVPAISDSRASISATPGPLDKVVSADLTEVFSSASSQVVSSFGELAPSCLD